MQAEQTKPTARADLELALPPHLRAHPPRVRESREQRFSARLALQRAFVASPTD